MSRIRTRVPGRYERPAQLRPALGDHEGELGVRAGYREGVRVRAALARTTTSPYHRGGTMPPADERRDRTVSTVESAGTTTRATVTLRETAGGRISEAPKDTASGRLVTIDVIRSGWNSSGSRYYPADVLERDVPKVYGRGTQMYIDHPSAAEGDDRPERSLQTLAGVFVDTPWAVREDGGQLVMRATARVFGPWQPLIREAWDTIGVSINGHGRGDYSTAEGREGIVIDELTYGRSVDFVTVPGAGGRILGLLESDRPAPAAVVTREAGSLGAYLESRIHLRFTELGDELYGGGYVNRTERITLSGAIGDALAAFVSRIEKDAAHLYQRGRFTGPDAGTVTAEAAAVRTREATVEQYRAAIDEALRTQHGGMAWVQDFDPDTGTVWFTASGTNNEPARTFQQSYITSRGTVTLTGARVHVRARTVYEPVVEQPTTESTTPPAPPAGAASTTTTTTADGLPMPATPTEVNDMGDKSPDVVAREAAEAQRDEAIRTAEADRLELARYKAGDAARPVIDTLLAEATDMPDLAKSRVRAAFPTAGLPLTESRALDEAALRTRVTEAITAEQQYAAQLLEAAGAGQVRGNGAVFGPVRTQTSTGTGTTESGPDDTVVQALIKQYESNGMTREAATAAVYRD